MVTTKDEKKEDEVLPFHVVEEQATPDPVEEVKPVKVVEVWNVTLGAGLNSVTAGSYSSEKDAVNAGATFLAQMPDTSFTVQKVYVQDQS